MGKRAAVNFPPFVISSSYYVGFYMLFFFLKDYLLGYG